MNIRAADRAAASRSTKCIKGRQRDTPSRQANLTGLSPLLLPQRHLVVSAVWRTVSRTTNGLRPYWLRPSRTHSALADTVYARTQPGDGYPADDRAQQRVPQMPDAPGDAVPESAQGFVAGMMAS